MIVYIIKYKRRIISLELLRFTMDRIMGRNKFEI